MSAGVGTMAKRAAEYLWYQRGRMPLLKAPVPCRLPYGGWFLAYGDAMGARVAGYRLSRHGYEEPQWRFVQHNLVPGSVFIDVGANQGFYTLLAAGAVGASGRVIAFEPATSERRKLQRNLRLNRLTNAVVEELALGDRTGRASFHLVLEHQGSWSSLQPPAADVRARRRMIEVRVTTLDSYLREREIDVVDMIKIDVEGGELGVLRGADHTLTALRPIVLCEVEDRRTRQWGYESVEIIRYLEQRKYTWRAADAIGAVRPLETVTAATNLVAVPEERVTQIEGAMTTTC